MELADRSLMSTRESLAPRCQYFQQAIETRGCEKFSTLTIWQRGSAAAGLRAYFFAIISVVPGKVLGISPCVSIALKPAFLSQSEYCDSVQHSPSGVCVKV